MRTLLILSCVLVSCAAQQGQMLSPIEQDRAQLRLEVPDAVWEPIFFKLINERAKIARLDDLRTMVLPGDDLEIRVWMGFGVTALQGYVVRRNKGQWSALRIPAIRPHDRNSRVNVHLTPKSGWDQLWKSLTNENILGLPDSAKFPGIEKFPDGVSYVVEINANRTYRTYMYGNPETQTAFNEARQMAKIARVLSDEFGTDPH